MKNQGGQEETGDLALTQAVARGEQGAWEQFLRRYSDLVYSCCSLVFSGRELDEEYLNTLSRLQADDYALLRAFDGRATLLTYLRLKLGDFLSGRILDLFREDPERAWSAFERFFSKDITRAVAKCFPLSSKRETLEDGATHQDLYQEICSFLIDDGYSRIMSYDRRGSFTGYIRPVIRNLCMDLFRKREGRRRLPEGIQRLSPFDQEVFRLVHWQQCSEKELLEVLRDEAGNLYSPERIEKALARVREALSSRKEGVEPRSERPHRELSLSSMNEEAAGKDWEIPDFSSSPEPTLLNAEEERAQETVFAVLREALAKLPAELGLYINLRFYSNPPNSPRDIARLMGRPEKEIYRIRQQAISTLKGVLKAKGIEKFQPLSV